MKARAIPILVVAAFLATPLSAGEGKIPIYQPTTITENGHYILTRNISSDTGPILQIEAADVVVDLGGHVLRLTDTTTDVVRIMNAQDRRIRLQNGSIQGGRNGVGGEPTGFIDTEMVALSLTGQVETGIYLTNVRSFLARNIVIDSDGLGMDLRGGTPGVDLGSARIFDVFVEALRGIKTDGLVAVIRNCRIHSGGTGLRLSRSPGSVVEGNLFVFPGSDVTFQPQPEPPGIWAVDSPGVQMKDNVIHGPLTGVRENHGIAIDATSHDTFVLGNTIHGCGDRGIDVLSSGNFIQENLVNRNGGDGIFVGGSNNVVEGNRVGHNSGDGIYFDNANGPHVYRFNVLRGNIGGAIGGDETNTDAGGNVL